MEPRIANQVRVHRDLGSASSALARRIVDRARLSVREQGSFSLVLSGGSTPQTLYRLLTGRFREELPWRATEVFFGDERCVSPRSPESNYRAAREALLSRVPISRGRIHRMPGEVRPLTRAATRYSQVVGPGILPSSGRPFRVRFDLVLLGIGDDGHTASLFPHDPALDERRRAVVAVPRPGKAPFVPRLTLTLPALASSREICFLVVGEEKAPALNGIFNSGPEGNPGLPASLVRSQGPVAWFLDRAAASGVSITSRKSASA